MAMRTAAKSISQRLLSGSRNFCDKAKVVVNRLNSNSMCSDCVEELRLQPNKCPICTQPVEELIGIKAESHNIDKVFWQLAEQVEKLSTEMISLKDSYRCTIEIANSNRTYLDVTKTRLCVLGCASAMAGYYWGS